MSKTTEVWYWLNVLKNIVNGNAGHSFDQLDEEGNTALCSCILTPDLGAKALSDLLKQQNIALDTRNRDGDTALHLAVREQNFECAEILVKAKASLLSKDRVGQTPLHLAAMHSPQIFCLLMDSASAEEKAQLLTAKTNNGATVLHLTAMYGDPQILYRLLEENVDTSSVDASGNTAITLALDSCNLPFVFALTLTKGLILSQDDQDQLFAFMEEDSSRKFFDDELLAMGALLLPWLKFLCEEVYVPEPQKMFALLSLFRMYKNLDTEPETRDACIIALRTLADSDSTLPHGLRALAILMARQDKIFSQTEPPFSAFQNSPVSFGVEVEAYGLPNFMRRMLLSLIRDLKLLPGYRFTFDGSIKPTGTDTVGFEIPTAVLNDPRSVAIFGTFLTMLEGLGAKTNASCGLHVHLGTFGTEEVNTPQSQAGTLPPIGPSEMLVKKSVSVGDFQLSVMKQFTLNYLDFQKHLNTTLRRGRAYFSDQANAYTKNIRCTPESIRQANTVLALAEIVNPGRDRLHTINFNNLLPKDDNDTPLYTIEVRHREGSIHPIPAIAWVQLVHGMMRYSIERVEEMYQRHYPEKTSQAIDRCLASDERTSSLFTEWFRAEARGIKPEVLSTITCGNAEMGADPWIFKRLLDSSLLTQEQSESVAGDCSPNCVS